MHNTAAACKPKIFSDKSYSFVVLLLLFASGLFLLVAPLLALLSRSVFDRFDQYIGLQNFT